MRNWFDRLLDPEENPSSYSLLSVLAGLSGIIIAILSIFIQTLQTIETIETSKFLIYAGLGGKLTQTVLNQTRKKNE